MKTSGDAESRPKSIPDLIRNAHNRETVIIAPTNSGAYRLFGYVYDGKGHAAHVNIPFYVDQNLTVR